MLKLSDCAAASVLVLIASLVSPFEIEEFDAGGVRLPVNSSTDKREDPQDLGGLQTHAGPPVVERVPLSLTYRADKKADLDQDSFSRRANADSCGSL